MTSPDDRTRPYMPERPTLNVSPPPNQYWPPRPTSPPPAGFQQPYAYGPPPGYQPPPASKPRRGKLLIAGIIAAVLILGGAAAAYLFTRGGGVSEQTAQRECRTALEQEGSRRAANLGSPGTMDAMDIVVTVKRVDVQETYKTEAGYVVNGTVAYTLTSGLLPQVEQQVSLTCTAVGSGDAVTTTVANRS